MLVDKTIIFGGYTNKEGETIFFLSINKAALRYVAGSAENHGDCNKKTHWKWISVFLDFSSVVAIIANRFKQ